MAKIIQFPSKTTKKSKNTDIARKQVEPTNKTATTSLSEFHWIKFEKPPAINAIFDVKLLDKLLINYSDFDPPPSYG